MPLNRLPCSCIKPQFLSHSCVLGLTASFLSHFSSVSFQYLLTPGSLFYFHIFKVIQIITAYTLNQQKSMRNELCKCLPHSPSHAEFGGTIPRFFSFLYICIIGIDTCVLMYVSEILPYIVQLPLSFPSLRDFPGL